MHEMGPATLAVFCIFAITVASSAENGTSGSENGTLEESAPRRMPRPRAASYHYLTDRERQLIVDKHNELRRIVQPGAADMLEMSWNYGLEDLATYYSQYCIYEHNSVREAAGFSYVGENLFLSRGTDIQDDYVAQAVVAWDAEKADYNYGSQTCQPGKVCGHYTQTAWAGSYKVGCGMTTCATVQVDASTTWNDATLFVCNYGPGGNMMGKAPYATGSACSKCPTGDTCVDRLCYNATRHNSGPIIRGSFWTLCIGAYAVLKLNL